MCFCFFRFLFVRSPIGRWFGVDDSDVAMTTMTATPMMILIKLDTRIQMNGN